ncbi:MAG: NUDIX hydrolase [Asticcacaulis sp.]
MTDRPLPPWDTEDRNAVRPRWQPRNVRVVHDSPWIALELSEPIAPTGNEARYGLIRFKNRAVGVLPLHDDGSVTMVGQMRYAFDAYSWEMPEGGVPFDEDMSDGARRELREEVGLEAAELVEVLQMDLSNSVCDEVAVCYLATGLSAAQTDWDDTESLETARIPFKDVLEAVIKGQIRDSLTVATVLRVYHMAVTGALPARLSALIV